MRKRKQKLNKGITLIALVITIIVLLILAGITIMSLTGENGVLKKADNSAEENRKQTATEKMNLKITNIQIETYGKKQKMPSLQELADELCEDEADEIDYVFTKSQKKQASLDKIQVKDEDTSIFTKLREYPYEFEINRNLQLASIDGIKVATNDENITVTKSEWEEVKNTINELKAELEEAKTIGVDFDSSNWSSGKVECTYSKHSCTVKVYELTKKTSATQWVKVATLPEELRNASSIFHAVPIQRGAGVTVQDRIIVDGNQVYIETMGGTGITFWGGITFTY